MRLLDAFHAAILAHRFAPLSGRGALLHYLETEGPPQDIDAAILVADAGKVPAAVSVSFDALPEAGPPLFDGRIRTLVRWNGGHVAEAMSVGARDVCLRYVRALLDELPPQLQLTEADARSVVIIDPDETPQIEAFDRVEYITGALRWGAHGPPAADKAAAWLADIVDAPIPVGALRLVLALSPGLYYPMAAASRGGRWILLRRDGKPA